VNDAHHAETAPPARTTGGQDKPLRSDARRNRAKLLDVAEEVFAEKGTSASTEEVARRAGVGIGTVFRHFPTKHDLLEAVFAAGLRRLADDAAELGAAEDPGGAFFAFFTRMVDYAREKNAFTDALSSAGVDVRDITSPIKEDFHRSVTALLTRAQEAGAVRPDIGFPEVITLLVGASHAAQHPVTAPDVRHRALVVVLDGLRPHGAD
jgi:AcrR family transcriptional regulator